MLILKKRVVLDIETTGLYCINGDKVVEICCYKFYNEKKIEDIFHEYITPEIFINNDAYLIHKIDNEFLFNKPLFLNIIKRFLNFIFNSEIIIHNSKFDVNFLNYELNLLGYKEINFYCFKITDTLIMSRKLFPGKRNSLNALCKRFNINLNIRKLHSAFIDCKLLYKVYLFLIKKKKNFSFKVIKFKIKKNNFIRDNLILKTSFNDLYKNNKFFKKNIKYLL